MAKIITGYFVVFKGRPESRRDSMSLTIDQGIEAIRQWEEGRPTLLLKGGAYSFSGIDSIEPTYATGEYHKQKALADGSGIDEQELKNRLTRALSPGTGSAGLPAGGRTVEKQLGTG